MPLFKISRNQFLAVYSTFSIGGKAKSIYHAENRQELIGILDFLHKKRSRFGIFACGSNIVFPDKGVTYPMIQVTGGKIRVHKSKVLADAGVRLSDLVDFYLNKNLAGLEKFSGIPGSVGGAVVGNAGAYGESIGDYIIKVEVWQNGQVKFLERQMCKFSYRHSIFKEKPFIVLRVELKAVSAEGMKLKKISAEIIRLRELKYKSGLKCPGSFFKNIPVADASDSLLSKINQNVIKGGKIPAGYLLESVGAKGVRVGGIKVADYHGNLFINDGQGTFADVKKLAKILKERVKRKYGITLEEEIRYF